MILFSLVPCKYDQSVSSIIVDIATLYGNNAGSFDMTELHPSLKNALKIIRGDFRKETLIASENKITFRQENFGMCEREHRDDIDGYNLDTKVVWKTPNGSVNMKGRLIGGCIDCLNFIIGTKYDGVAKFVEKYKQDRNYLVF